MENKVEKSQLQALADKANEEHRQCAKIFRLTLGHAMRAGDALLEAKEIVAHGRWLPWLEKNFEGSARTAQNYMRLAERREELANAQNAAHLSIDAALKAIAAPKPERVTVMEWEPGEPPTHEGKTTYNILVTGSPSEPGESVTQRMPVAEQDPDELRTRDVLTEEDWKNLPSGELTVSEKAAFKIHGEWLRWKRVDVEEMAQTIIEECAADEVARESETARALSEFWGRVAQTLDAKRLQGPRLVK